MSHLFMIQLHKYESVKPFNLITLYKKTKQRLHKLNSGQRKMETKTKQVHVPVSICLLQIK